MAVLAGVGIFIAERPKETAIEKKVVVAPAVALELEYSVTMQDQKDGKPVGQPYRIPAESSIVLRPGDQAVISILPTRDGFLYVLDDGPMPDGTPVINLLSPSPGGNAQISAGTSFRIPLAADAAQGEEKLYLIFSAEPVGVLELFKGLDSKENEHVVVRDGPQTASLRQFLKDATAPAVKKDDDAKKTVLSSSQKVLVYRILLPHH